MKMPPFAHAQWRVSTKILLSAGLACSILLILLGGFSARMWTREHEDQVAALHHEAEALAHTIDEVDASGAEAAKKAFSLLKEKLPPELLTTGEADGKTTLMMGGIPLDDDFSAVDAFAQSTGGVATVFVRQGEDYRRLVTSLKKEDGSRAVGTLLDRKHPAWAQLNAGQPFSGRAVLFGRTYMTRYEPVVQAGKVIGSLFIGSEMTVQQKMLGEAFQRAGRGESRAYALDLREGPTLGAVFGLTQSGERLAADAPVVAAIRSAVSAGQTSGDLPGWTEATGLGPAGERHHLAWVWQPKWQWAVVTEIPEAAMMAGSSPTRAFWRITLRMAFPALCALTLLIFVRAFESFEVPALVGLVVGGVMAAPFGAIVARRVPARPLMATVGLLVCALANWQLVKAFGFV